MEKAIEVKNLIKSYGNIIAVNDISFCVNKGEFFSFLGINGAGKSTTIHSITGMHYFESGSIYVNGLDVSKNIEKVKSTIGVVFQNSGLDGSLSVYDNLFYRGCLYNIDKQVLKNKIKQLSQILEFSEYLNRPLNKLSGGQKRKIDLARALIHDPEIVILDEPTTGLDPKTRKLMWNYLNKLREERKLTIFLTTHYMEEAAQSDYIVIIDEGKIVATGTPNELKEKYAYDYIKVFKHENDLSVLKNVVNQYDYKMVEDKDYVVIFLPSVKDAKELIIKHPYLFNDFEIYKGDMDDVFLNVTGKDIGD